MNRSTVITPSVLIAANRMNYLDPNNLKDGFTLEELCLHLNCSRIEVVYPVNSVKGFKSPILICEEEALFKSSKTYNLLASAIAGKQIVGNVILTESKNIK